MRRPVELNLSKSQRRVRSLDVLGQCFLGSFRCQNGTLKVCDGTYAFGIQGMVLPCIEVKRFEENMLF